MQAPFAPLVIAVIAVIAVIVFGSLGGSVGILIDSGLRRLDVGGGPRSRALLAILVPSLIVLAVGWYRALIVIPPSDHAELASGFAEGLLAIAATLAALLMMIGCVIGLSIRNRVAQSAGNERKVVLGSCLIIAIIAVSGSSSSPYESLIAPSWTNAGDSVTLIRRDVRTTVIGPFALVSGVVGIPSIEVISDRLTLERLEIATGKVSPLAQLSPGSRSQLRLVDADDPLPDVIQGRLVPLANGRLKGNIQALRTHSRPVKAASFVWSGQTHVTLDWNPADMADYENGVELLNGDRELVLAGRYGDALVMFVGGKPDRVLLSTRAAARAFANGLTPQVVASYALISRLRLIRKKEALEIEEPRLQAQYMRQGMSQASAISQADRDLEDRGLLPRGTTLVARKVSSVPPHVRLFRISGQRFDVGLFTDIGNAIAHPGQKVEADDGSYLRYENDDTGPQLQQYLRDGADRFAVDRDGRIWLIIKVPAEVIN